MTDPRTREPAFLKIEAGSDAMCDLSTIRRLPKFLAICALLIALTASTGSPVMASDTELKVIDSTDHPWPSIGRVNFAGYRTTTMCTGTLVSPRVVLTAAHCLFNMRTLRPLPVKDILFLAGVRRDQYAARLEAACVLTAEDYAPQKRPKLRDVYKDLGIIVLKEDSALPPVPALTPKEARELDKNTRFQSVGYRRSRRFLPTVVPACKVIGTVDNSWITDCPTEQGASGGPLLVETPGGMRVAGVMSAKLDGERSAIVPFHEWQDLLRSPACAPGASQPTSTPQANGN